MCCWERLKESPKDPPNFTTTKPLSLGISLSLAWLWVKLKNKTFRCGGSSLTGEQRPTQAARRTNGAWAGTGGISEDFSQMEAFMDSRIGMGGRGQAPSRLRPPALKSRTQVLLEG